MTGNQQAFPSGDKAAFPSATYEPGMTLRDYFAGQALAGLMANIHQGDDGAPKYAYFLADAMLAARTGASS